MLRVLISMLIIIFIKIIKKLLVINIFCSKSYICRWMSRKVIELKIKTLLIEPLLLELAY